MLAWQEKLLSKFGDDASQANAFGSITGAAHALGFKYVCYGVCVTMPPGIIKGAFLENYPEMWMPRYAREGYIKVDPTISWAMKSQAPLLWSDSYSSAPAYWDDAHGHGLVHGWTQGVCAGPGAAGIFSMSRSDREIAASERKSDEVQWQWLSSLAHLTLIRSARSGFLAKHAPDLTRREIEVLQWSAAGKTQDDIAGILGRSGETVKFHLKNACQKLGCTNKTHAVAHAAYLGLLN
jgi:LuxR family transcriptional regulator, quorum-sensing system regulator SolR